MQHIIPIKNRLFDQFNQNELFDFLFNLTHAFEEKKQRANHQTDLKFNLYHEQTDNNIFIYNRCLL